MLSNLIHEAEHSYADVLKQLSPVDLKRMQSEMQDINSSLAQYIAINQNTLGRKDVFKNVQVEKKFLAEHCALNSKLEKIQKLNGDEHLEQNVRSSINQIVKIIDNSLSYIREDCLISASRIAKDLNKPAPTVHLNAVDILISQQIESVLRKISIHLIRNALNHGIESPKQRLDLGKPAAGVITVDANCTEHQLQIIMRDDGRGLAMHTLRKNGLKIGKLHSSSSPEDIANMIFESGVSTSHAVPHFSGRGMGMDAVKRLVEEAGGKVSIALKNSHDSAGNSFAFDTIIAFPITESFGLAS